MTILVVFVSCSKLAEFLHVAFISVENHHPVFFLLVCSSFSRYYVCKQRSVFQAASFGDLLLNEKQKKPFVSLKDEITITPDSSPVVFIQEIRRREIWEPRKGAQGHILCSSNSHAAVCYIKTTGDKSAITQSFLTAASLAQVDNAPNEADSNLFCRDTRGLETRSVKSFFLFCFCSSFKNLLRVFVIELPILMVRIWMTCFFSFHCDVRFWCAKHQLLR